MHEASESYPQRYEMSFSTFKEWAYSSLEIYKADLCSVLFPLLVHSFLDLIEAGSPLGGHFYSSILLSHFQLINFFVITRKIFLNTLPILLYLRVSSALIFLSFTI